MMEDQLPDRVRAAEQRREFRQLLDASSIGRLPKGFEKEPGIGSGQCNVCRNDQCGEVGCVVPDGCACSCTPDKEQLTSAISDALTRLLCRDISEDDAAEIANDLYRLGWRRES